MTSLHNNLNLGTTARTQRREEAGSLTLRRPVSQPSSLLSAETNATQEVVACGGNTLLLEARLCEMTSSIRALSRSNAALEDALAAAASQEDPDFWQALEENKLAMRRQLCVAVALVEALQRNGSHIELEDDLQLALLTSTTRTVEVVEVVSVGRNAGGATTEAGGTTAEVEATALDHAGSSVIYL